MVDVARALGVSHGSVYRHFPSKAALRDAVTERWLARISAPLAAAAAEAGPRRSGWGAGWTCWSPPNGGWHGGPELFATYLQLAADAREVVRPVDDLTGQLARIIADGVTRGQLAAAPATAGRAVFATARFHNPTTPRSGPTPASTPPTRASGRWCSAGWAPGPPMRVPELVLPTSALAPPSPRGPSRDPTRPAVMVVLPCGYAEPRTGGRYS